MKNQSSSLISSLNQNLADTIDLKLQAKQAHWNLKGANFIALHELFDKVASAVDEYADMQAERAVQLGGVALGTLQEVSAKSKLRAYPTDILNSAMHVSALSSAMRTVADNTRKLIDVSDELGDKVTADMFTEIARELDKWVWFVSSHETK